MLIANSPFHNEFKKIILYELYKSLLLRQMKKRQTLRFGT